MDVSKSPDVDGYGGSSGYKSNRNQTLRWQGDCFSNSMRRKFNAMKKIVTAAVLMAVLALPGLSQKTSVASAASVSAELTKGNLSPALSKPGDQVMLKLNDDVKSGGEVVLKKGATITGVVRKVSRIDGKAADSSRARSLLVIEWQAPAAQGRSSQSLMVALQSVTQLSPAYNGRQDADNSAAPGAGAPGVRPGGLLDGSLATVASIGSGAVSVAGDAGPSVLGSDTHTGVRENAALPGMPSVAAVDAETTKALETDFGMSAGGNLFQTGHGQLLTAGGLKQSLDIFSHMNNDTVLTSRSANFEISSGAQMQLLIGMHRN
jgi:hypothetical protein